MQKKKISNKIIFISLTIITFLLYWYGKEIASYFDTKWLVKYPKHYSFPFAIYTTSFVKWLINEGVKEENIIIYGESLGTGVATEIAQNKKFAGVILESPFTLSLIHISEPTRRS